MEEMKGQQCIFCGKKTLTLMQDELDIPYFGKVLVFSMKCENVDCNYVKSDVEAVGIKEPCKVTFEVKDKKDLNVRVIRSSTSHIKIPAINKDISLVIILGFFYKFSKYFIKFFRLTKQPFKIVFPIICICWICFYF